LRFAGVREKSETEMFQEETAFHILRALTAEELAGSAYFLLSKLVINTYGGAVATNVEGVYEGAVTGREECQ